MEQQLGALLQAQQMMQQNVLELMNHFASEKSDKSEKKKMDQLDWRALRERCISSRVASRSGSTGSSGS